MSSPSIAGYVVTGASGSGKTTLLTRLVQERPSGERWAILVNDVGVSPLRASDDVLEREVVVRELRGCMCCTGRVGLHAAVVALLRRAKPQRLLIEASAAAQPEALVSVLRVPALARHLTLRAVVAVVSARHLRAAEYTRNDTYRMQMAAADVIVLASESHEQVLARSTIEEIAAGTPVIGMDEFRLGALDAM